MIIILKFLKKVIASAVFLYAYNSLTFSINVVVPINFFNLLLVSFFGLPAMFGLIFFSFLF